MYTTDTAGATAPRETVQVIRLNPAKADKPKAMFAIAIMPDLHPSARAVGACLVDCANTQSGLCCPSSSYLEGATGLSRASVFRGISELEKAGLIRRERPESGGPTRYWIAWRRFEKIGDAARERAKSKAKESRTKRRESTERAKLYDLARQTWGEAGASVLARAEKEGVCDFEEISDITKEYATAGHSAQELCYALAPRGFESRA